MSAVRAESCVSACGSLLETAMNNHLKLGCQIKMAERELGAFLHAVAELYGPGEAMISAQDWLDELELLDYIPEATPREWRLLTIAAGNRLSKRVSKQARREKSVS